MSPRCPSIHRLPGARLTNAAVQLSLNAIRRRGVWKLQDEMEKLVSLVKQPHVEEQDTLAQLEKVLAMEREIKRAQVSLLVRIKNKLTPEQQAKLAAIRSGSGN